MKFLTWSAVCALGFSVVVSGVAWAHKAPAQPVKSEAYRWKSIKIGAGGFVTGILFHPAQRGLAYCRTDIGGAYRWDARSNQWVPLLDWLTKPDWNLYGVESIGLDPNDPKKLYLACGTYLNPDVPNGAILRSNDQGRTFERTDMPFKMGGNQDGRSIGERLAVDPSNGQHLYFGSRTDGLWESKDGAKTWAKVASFPIQTSVDQIGVGVVAFDPGSKHGVYVSTGNKADPIYVSHDSGVTWAPLPFSLGDPIQLIGFIPHQMKISELGDLFVTCGDGPGPNGMSNGRVYRCHLSTGVWKDISPVTPNAGSEKGFGFAGLSIEWHKPNVIAVASLDRWNPGDDVFYSTDFGDTWTGLKAKSTMDATLAPYMKWGVATPRFGWWFGAVAIDPFNPKHVEFGTGANIWEANDVTGSKVTWHIGGVGMEETATIDLFSPTAGPHLISGLGDIGGFTHIDLDTTPAGMTLNPMLGNTDSIDGAGDMVVRVGRGQRGQINGGFSLDDGLTWKPFGSAPVPGREGGSIALTADDAAILWAPNGSVPYYSADQGIIWAASAGIPPTSGRRQSYQVLADRVKPGLLYAVTGSQLYRSDDGGVHFQKVPALGLAAAKGPIRATPGKAGELWAPTNNGLLFSADYGASFKPIGPVERADCVGFGKAAPGSSYPAIFISGRVSGVEGAFRSDDQGTTWVKITDAKHEYGTQDHIAGDPRIYGRVYLGTNGRGVFYGDIAK